MGALASVLPACSEGKVPVAVMDLSRNAPKGNPLAYSRGPTGTSQGRAGDASNPCGTGDSIDGFCYYYASTGAITVAGGSGMVLEIEAPLVDTGGVVDSGSHSLGEIAVVGVGSTGINTAELGFMVHAAGRLPYPPTLFVYHFVNGQSTCYNGCGWIQYSNTWYPGMDLTSLVGSRVYTGWVHAPGAWWAWFGDQWLGYLEDANWDGAFTKSDYVEWFGEVAEVPNAGTIPPQTQMGNGTFAEDPGSASITTPCIVDAATGGCLYGRQAIFTTVTSPEYYSLDEKGPSGFRYGGPGAPAQ